MRLSYHPATQRDVNEILDHYRQESGDVLAERFYAELMERLNDVAAHPERFGHYLGHSVFRRAKLHRFPHVIVFRILRDRIRVTVIKHEKRHPAFGLGRK
jgi:toxin ParE1/3/4